MTRVRFKPLWRRLPRSVREAAHRITQAAGRLTLPTWARLARLGRSPAASPEPVTVMGLLRSSIGIGQGARLFLEALERCGLQVQALDAGDLTGWRPELSHPARPPLRRGGVLLSHLNPPELLTALRVSLAKPLWGRRHIGYWAWELPIAPQDWAGAFRYVDEVWAPSRFTADAVAALAPSRIDVRVVPHPIWAAPVASPDRKGFGLPLEACLVLAAVDLKSTMARKNPHGAIEAFRSAVPIPGQGAALVCKISGSNSEPELADELRRRCADRADIVFIDEVLSSDRMAALVASVDIILSLHRAEGFGLLLAEGMRLGKVVVATGWSGNMDFMNEHNTIPIGYRLTPVVDPQGMYPEQAFWAEPDLQQASAALAGLISDPQERHALGRRAAAAGGPVFDQHAWSTLVSGVLDVTPDAARSVT